MIGTEGNVFGKLLVVIFLAWVGAACGDAPPENAPAAPVEGVHGIAPAPVGGTPSVIVLHPSTGEPQRPEREMPRIDQLGLVFNPTELMVRVGEQVAFTNSETITHNVHLRFTDTDSTVLNVDTDPGGRAEFVFEREGGYDVLCDTHPGMRAFVYASKSIRRLRGSGRGLPDPGRPPGQVHPLGLERRSGVSSRACLGGEWAKHGG